MIEATLGAELRQGRGKEAARKLRNSGRVPAVLYGKGSESVALSIGAKAAEHLFQSISVENTIIALQIEGEAAPVSTLVREIQVHPFKPLLVHVDFYRIRAGEMLELEVPVHLVGIPIGVRNSGGVLQLSVHDLTVRCLPSKIPTSIDVDVSALEIGDSIHVSDLTVDEGVEIQADQELTICSVAAPRVETTVDDADEETAEAEEEEDDA